MPLRTETSWELSPHAGSCFSTEVPMQSAYCF